MSDLDVKLKFLQDNDETIICRLNRRFEARLVDKEEGDLLFDVKVPYTLYKDTGQREYDPAHVEFDENIEVDDALKKAILEQVKVQMISDGIMVINHAHPIVVTDPG